MQQRGSLGSTAAIVAGEASAWPRLHTPGRRRRNTRATPTCLAGGLVSPPGRFHEGCGLGAGRGLEQRRQPGGVDGLDQVVIEAGGDAALTILVAAEAGDGDHQGAALGGARADATGHLQPVHPGEADVEQDDLEFRARQRPLRRRAVVNDLDLLVAQLQEVAQSLGGVDVVVCDQHAAAERTLSRADFEVILLDISLPGMDGLEVARRVRARVAVRRPLMIAITGLGRDDDRQRSIAAGFDHHLVKPIDPTRLAALLETAPGPG